MKPAIKIQERYQLYSKAHGREPDDQLAYDSKAFPVAPMLPYLKWVNVQITQYYVLFPEQKGCLDQDQFTDFIRKKVLNESKTLSIFEQSAQIEE